MTEKEFRRLRRAELVEIIFALQEREDLLKQELEQTRSQLAEARQRELWAGSIHEAVAELEHLVQRAEAREGVRL